MSDFTAKIVAQLDTSQIPSQLAKIESMISSRKFEIKVDTSSIKGMSQAQSIYSDLYNLQKRINSTRVKLAGLDVNKDKAQISALSGQLNRLMADYNRLHSTFGKSLSTSQLDNLSRGFDVASSKIEALNAKALDVKGVDKIERSFARLKQLAQQMGNIELKIKGLDASKNASEIAQLTSQFNALKVEYDKVKAALGSGLDGLKGNQLKNYTANLKNQLAQLDAKAQDTQRRLVESINTKMTDGSMTASIAKVRQEYERLATTGHSKLAEVKADIESLSQLQSKLGSSNDVNELVSNYDKFSSTLKKVKNSLSTISAESKTYASALQISKLDNKIASWMEKNTRAAKEYGQSLEELRAKLASLASSSSPVSVSSVNAIEQEFNAIDQAAAASGKKGKTWGSTFKDSFRSISQYISAPTVFYAATRGLKEMYENVVNIDSAMVELKKVTNETDDTYDTFLKGTNKRAQEIGTTITGLVSSTGDFARLGYTFDESQKLAETANIYAVVGDEVESVDTATESIISTMKAFNIEAGDSMSIVDKFNEVGNNFAISSGGIGEAMMRSASSMAAANNTIDETVALITAANAVVQDPAKVGNAFKTISMRIRGATTELEEAGESTEGMAESTAKLQEEMLALSGVDIMKNKDEFKSTYQIMDELSQKWGNLTDIQQASIIELLAGKHQGNVMASLMNNFDEARKALAVSINSEGSAMTEHEKWLDSIEAKQLQLKAAWEGLSQDFLSADFVKTGVDTLRGTVNVIDAVVNKIGTLGTVAAGVGGFGLKKFISAKGLGGLLSVATKLPVPLAAVAAGITAVGVGVYAAKQHYDKVKLGEYLESDAAKIKEHADNITELNSLYSEVSELELVINSSSSTQTEIEAAKQRLQEIADLVNEKYELNITANADELQQTLKLLDHSERSNLLSEVDNYAKDLDKSSYSEAKQNYKSAQKKYDDLTSIYNRLESIGESYTIASEVEDPDVRYSDQLKVLQRAKKLYEEINELGYGDLVGDFSTYLADPENALFGRDAINIGTELAKATDTKSGYDEVISNFKESSTKVADYLSQVLASDVMTDNAYGIDTDVDKFKQLGQTMREAGADTDYLSQKFAVSKEGFTQLSEAIANGNLDNVVENYLDIKDSIGETGENAVRGAAMIKQGFSDISQITPESLTALYDDMKLLGKQEGLSDEIANAVEGTSLLAAGFKNVEEATAAGDVGIAKVLTNAKELKEYEGVFTDDMDVSDKANQLTELAHSIGLIPENKAVRIDVDTGEVSVITDVTKEINSLWDNGGKALNIRVNTEVDGANIDDFEGKVDRLDNKDCTVTFNVDGSPARATIGDVEYSLSEYDASTGTATLYAESGEAIGTIDLLNGKIDLIPKTNIISFSADYSGVSGIYEYAAFIDSLDSRGELNFQLNAEGNIEIFDKANNLISELEKDGNIAFHVNADGNLDVLNTLTGAIHTLDKNGNIHFVASAKIENLGEIEGLQGELESLNGQTCTVMVDADNTPLAAKIGESTAYIADYNSQTGTATLVAENGEAIAQIDFVNKKISALPNEKNIGVDATVNYEEGETPTTVPDVEGTANYTAGSTPTTVPNASGTADYNTGAYPITVPSADGTANFGLGTFPSTVPNASGIADFFMGTHPTSAPTIPGQANYKGNFPTSAPTLFGTIVYTIKKVFGGGSVDGTAHSGGTAFANGTTGRAFKSGNWGTKSDGVALGGELGEELVVRDGRFFTIGADSAEFFKYKKDDIIFNAEQTKQIFEKGKITHGKRRGKAFADGTTTFNDLSLADYVQNNDSSTNNSGSSSSDKNEELENYLKYAEKIYKVHQNELKYINDLQWGLNSLAKTEEERVDIVDTIEQAYKDLSANVVKDLEHNIDLTLRANPHADVSSYYRQIRDEAHREAERLRSVGYDDNSDEIQEQQTIWWDATEKLQEAYEDRIISRYDEVIGVLDHKSKVAEAKMENAETRGLMASTRYYEAMAGTEQQRLNELGNERKELLDTLNAGLASGEITEYSAAWYALKGEINGVTEAILESENALAEFGNEMRQITWDRFDYAQDSVSRLNDEADFLIELLGDDFYIDDAGAVSDIIDNMKDNSSDWWSASSSGRKRLERKNKYLADDISDITGKSVYKDDDGVWWIGNDKLYSYENGLNSSGMAVMGLHGMKYNVYMEQALAYEQEISKIESDIANNPYDTNLIARREELLDLQRDSILAAQDEKEAIRDMVEEGISVELDALQELIDKYKESLDSAKDLYDYQQRIAEHTDDIASIQKQLSAYANDTSEETKAKVQQLKVDLEEAEKDLQDEVYDKYISDQQELLDNLYSQYEETLNNRMDGVDVLIEDVIGEINSNSSSINDTLVRATGNVGTTISNEMSSIWTSESSALNTYLNSNGSLIGGFVLSANGYFESTTNEISGINTTLGSILGNVNTIVEYASVIAEANSDPEGTVNKMIQNSLDWWSTSDSGTKNTLSAENEKYGEALGFTKNNGSWYDSTGNLVYSISEDDKVRNIVSKMKSNSASWGAASASERSKLERENINYANTIANLTGKSVYKDGNGVWWIDDKELYSYKMGGLANYTGMAWLDGTPNKPEMVLDAQDTENLIALKNTLKTMSKQGLSLGTNSYSKMSMMSQTSRTTGISDILSGIQNQTNNSTRSIGDISINIPIEHVEDYNDFVLQLQKDKQFEKFVRSVSVDLMSGGSSLAKNKYTW